MKKSVLLVFVICLVNILPSHAEIFNLQTSGVTLVIGEKYNNYTGDYSFSLDDQRNTLVITKNSDKYIPFFNTGHYKIEHAEKVRDNYMGDAIALLASKNNIFYIVTITSKFISFSRQYKTKEQCWNFHLTD